MDSKSTAFLAVALVVGLAIGAAAGFFLWGNNGDTGNDDETYWFYLNFGEGSEKNGWYSGTGTSAAEGFDSAMVKAGMSYGINTNAQSYTAGYLQSVDDVDNGAGWSIVGYLWNNYSSQAQTDSIITSGGSYFSGSNGWSLYSGFGTGTDFKLGQSALTVFFMAVYGTDYSVADPTTDTGWMNSGPFAGAATA